MEDTKKILYSSSPLVKSIFQTQQSNSIVIIKERNVEENEKSYLLVLFFIGVINNTGYVLISTASQDMATKAGMDNYISLIQLSLIALSGVTRSINSKYLIKIPHKKRIFFAIIFTIFSFIIIAFSETSSSKWTFFTSLIGSVMCGTMQALGESVMLGYIKIFPPRIVAGWSSGTGFAGPFGSGLLLIFKGANIELYIIFFIMIPIQASYWLFFMWYEKRRQKYFLESDQNADSALSDEKNDSNSEEGAVQNQGDSARNKQLTIQNIKQLMPKMWMLATSLGVVYFLEYVIETGWADRAHPKQDSGYPSGFNGFLEENGFVILCFCYQIGVFISRSSLYLFKIKKVYILTFIQMGNFALWIFFAINKNVSMGIQIPCMIFVGLMGGGSYVNVNYLLLNHEEIEPTEKELAMNICSIFNDTGVLLSSLFVLFIDNVVMTNN